MKIPQWSRFECVLTSTKSYDNPIQHAELSAEFTGPSGQTRRVYGFWDGDNIWRVRFSPDEVGVWRYTTACSDASNTGLHQQSGNFTCTEPTGSSVFEQHGHLQLSLIHI